MELQETATLVKNPKTDCFVADGSRAVSAEDCHCKIAIDQRHLRQDRQTGPHSRVESPIEFLSKEVEQGLKIALGVASPGRHPCKTDQ